MLLEKLPLSQQSNTFTIFQGTRMFLFQKSVVVLILSFHFYFSYILSSLFNISRYFQPAARRTTPHRPLVLYVEAIIPQIVKNVTSIKNNITLSALPKGRILHKGPQRTALRNPRQSLDPNTKLMHKLYGALNQPLPPPTWTKPCPYLHF